LILLALSVGLRAWRLGDVPKPMATADEFHFMWCGLSLLAGEKATAWSSLEVIKNSANNHGVISWKGHTLNILTPALDHPPLYSLLAGIAAKWSGARPFQMTTDRGQTVRLWDVDLSRARRLSLILFVLTFLMFYDLAARRCGHRVALLALLIYGVAAHCVLHGRLLVTETLSTPILLASLCAWERRRIGRWNEAAFACCAIVLTAAALLTKLVAVCQAAVLVYLVLAEGRRREAIYPILGAVLGLACYLLYAWEMDWKLFWEVMAYHRGRFGGLAIIQQLLTHPLLVHQENFDYMVCLGWLALPAGLFAGVGARGKSLLVVPCVFLSGFVFFAAVPVMLGWHVLPLYPFLALATAIVFMRAWRRPEPFSYALIVLLLAPAAGQAIYRHHGLFDRLPAGVAWPIVGLIAAAAVVLGLLDRLGRRDGPAGRRVIAGALAFLAAYLAQAQWRHVPQGEVTRMGYMLATACALTLPFLMRPASGRALQRLAMATSLAILLVAEILMIRVAA
jgi:4-amino-4-deoxy-L-arabinose transferase-like glycosyltransferase